MFTLGNCRRLGAPGDTRTASAKPGTARIRETRLSRHAGLRYFWRICVWTRLRALQCMPAAARNAPRCRPVLSLKNQAGSKHLGPYKFLPRLLCSALNLAHTRILAGQARPELTGPDSSEQFVLGMGAADAPAQPC